MRTAQIQYRVHSARLVRSVMCVFGHSYDWTGVTFRELRSVSADSNGNLSSNVLFRQYGDDSGTSGEAREERAERRPVQP